MDKHVVSSLIRLNEAKALFTMKPLHDTSWHETPLLVLAAELSMQLLIRPVKTLGGRRISS